MERDEISSSTSSVSYTASSPVEIILYPLTHPQTHSNSSSTSSFHTPDLSPSSSPLLKDQGSISALDDLPTCHETPQAHQTNQMPSLPTFLKRSSSFSSSSPSHTQPYPPFESKRNDSSTIPSSVATANITPFQFDQEEEEWLRGEKDGDGKRALGVKGGQKFLARRDIQEALSLRDAGERYGDNGGERDDGPGFSIRERIGFPSGLSRERVVERIQTDLPERKDTISSRRTGQHTPSSSSPSSRRKPVPPLLASNDLQPLSTHSPTRPLSDSPSTPLAALQRDPILNASPLPPPSRRAPPISGLNQSQAQESGFGRKRNVSSGSQGSVSKDSVLRELGEGIRKERRRGGMFEEEKRKARLELKEIEGNLVVMREKFHTLNEQQELTIRNLKAEIDEIEEELAGADELDEVTAQEYLSLLSPSSQSHLASSTPPISSFDPSLLRSTSSSNSPARPLNFNPSKISALTGMKRGLNLKRRIETHLATYDSIPSNVSIPHQPLPRTDENESIHRGGKGGGRLLRKLSRSRMVPPPVQPIFPSHIPRTTSPTALISNDPSSPSPVDLIPPRPRRPPPISGQNSKKYSKGYPVDVSTFESEDTGKEMRRKGSYGGRMRKRSNTSFKEGLNGTLKILFPSNAPKGGQAGGNEQNNINHWLRAG